MSKILITNASWEPRYALGTERLIRGSGISKVISFFSNEFEKRTYAERFHVRSVCSDANVEYIEFGYPLFSPLVAWKKVSHELVGLLDAGELALDITTMPRLMVWTLLSLIRICTESTEVPIFYHRPQDYCGGWVSRDPQQPFIVPRCAGLTNLGKSTALFAISGFDTERISHLIAVFEPTDVIVGIQVGSQFENESRNRYVNEVLLQEVPGARHFDIDVYSPDCGMAAMEKVILPVLSTHNVLAASLGPKPSAVGLMMLRDLHEDIGLVYTPSREYNENYSSGLGEMSTFIYHFPRS